MTKAELRQQLRRQRAALDPQAVRDASRQIEERVLAMDVVRQAPRVCCYVSIGAEVHTHRLIESLLAMGKIVAAPRVTHDGRAMDMIEIRRLDELVKSRLGLLEPPAPPEVNSSRGLDSASAGDVCLTPCVAVTQHGDRLGMGGGFYDRWLAEHETVTAIALAFESQVVEKIAVEPHDRPVQWVVTESRCIATSHA